MELSTFYIVGRDLYVNNTGRYKSLLSFYVNTSVFHIVSCDARRSTPTGELFVAFPRQQWLREGTTCYVIRTLLGLLNLLEPEIFFLILALLVYKM